MKQQAYFDDVQLGEVINYGNFLVTLEETISFAKKWDPQSFHIDESAAKNSVFEGITACTAHIFSIMSILAHSEPKPLAIAAGLGMQDLKLLAPVRPGDVLSMTVTTIEKKLSQSRPDRGIVRRAYNLMNQNGEVLCTHQGTVMVYKKEA